MNVFKILLCDIREGILKNKRFISAPLLAVFVCMAAHTRVSFLNDSFEMGAKPTLFNLFLEAFRGSDPLSKIREMHAPIPYMWLAVFIFSMFTAFDYSELQLLNIYNTIENINNLVQLEYINGVIKVGFPQYAL